MDFMEKYSKFGILDQIIRDTLPRHHQDKGFRKNMQLPQRIQAYFWKKVLNDSSIQNRWYRVDAFQEAKAPSSHQPEFWSFPTWKTQFWSLEATSQAAAVGHSWSWGDAARRQPGLHSREKPHTCLHCDDALPAHLLHGVRYDVANFFVSICRNCSNLK